MNVPRKGTGPRIIIFGNIEENGSDFCNIFALAIREGGIFTVGKIYFVRMKTHIFTLSLIVILVSTPACGRRAGAANATRQKNACETPLLPAGDDTKTSAKESVPPSDNSAPSVPLPSIPSFTDSENAAMEYLLLHYWDKTDFSDPRWPDYPETMEEAFSRFTAISNMYPDLDVSREAMHHMMEIIEEKATPENYDLVTGLADKYLYDPNSPLRNEELYITVLQSIIANPSLEDMYKIAPRERLRMALKNRAGTKATDFSYTASDGAHGRLYSLHAEYILLFFYNLGCPACRALREELTAVLNEEPLASMTAEGRLKVLAVYPDADMSQWDAYAGDIPSEWINAYDPDQTINSAELYDLKAIPSLYLLDKDKRVLLKDFVDPSLLYRVVTAGAAQ